MPLEHGPMNDDAFSQSTPDAIAQDRRRRRRQQGRRRLTLLVVSVIAMAAVLAAVLVARAGGGDGVRSATAAGSGALSPSPTPSPPVVWVATTARPVRVWIGGDSLGGELVWGLSPFLRDAGVFRTRSFYKESSGICRYDYFHWGRKLASVMSELRPRAVVFMLGANDTQSVWTASGWITYGTAEWKTAYGQRVGRLMDTMLKAGARRVYWVGMPIMREGWRNPRMRVINGVFRAQAEKRPGVRYIDIWALFSDADGHYVAKWRGSDGVHFSLTGAQLLGKRVYRFIRSDWLPTTTLTAAPSPSVSASSSPSPSPPPGPSPSPAAESV